jgi:hypothetical protein
MQIDQPNGIVPCRCGTTNAVCVKGRGAIDGNQIARWVHAKIYQPPGAPDDESVPPSDAVKVAPRSDGTWCIGYLDGAVCVTPASSSSSSTLPQNKIYAWAEFVREGNPYFVREVCFFQGICQANLPECCASSSSSST